MGKQKKQVNNKQSSLWKLFVKRVKVYPRNRATIWRSGVTPPPGEGRASLSNCIAFLFHKKLKIITECLYSTEKHSDKYTMDKKGKIRV